MTIASDWLKSLKDGEGEYFLEKDDVEFLKAAIRQYVAEPELNIDGYTLTGLQKSISAYRELDTDGSPMQWALEAAVKIALVYKSQIDAINGILVNPPNNAN